MNRKIYNTLILLNIGLIAASCNFLDVDPQIIQEEEFYKTKEEAFSGLVGVYGAMSRPYFYGESYSITLSYADDLCYYNRNNQSSLASQYKHDATDLDVYRAWTDMYAGIKNANSFLDVLDHRSAEEREKIDPEGYYYNEARFLRAYYHFLIAQAWGDVPLRNIALRDASETTALQLGATPQYEVLKWVATEMEACIPLSCPLHTIAPSRANMDTMKGVLARVYLFMAGESIVDADGAPLSAEVKTGYCKRVQELTKEIIDGKAHRLNPDYTKVFINMITDAYDTDYHESMWEVDFKGDRTSADRWTNGKNGNINGLMSTGAVDFDKFKCNYSYGQYNGSLKLWDLYLKEDRPAGDDLTVIVDVRQEWNMCPYNYKGGGTGALYELPADYTGDNPEEDIKKMKGRKSIDKVSYKGTDKKFTRENPLTAPAIRNCGKWRRETKYEGVKDSKSLFTGINYSLLRYSDVLLMYAEAENELSGPLQSAYDAVKEVRDRAGVATRPLADYDRNSFRQLIRNERGRELCFESLRKYDLIRWGIFYDAIRSYGDQLGDGRWDGITSEETIAAGWIPASVQYKHQWLPIPSVELGVNPKLKQNPNW